MKRLVGSQVRGLLVALTLGCGPGIVGTGQVVEEVRVVPAFSSLHVEDGLTVLLELGPRSVVVRGDDNLLPYLDTFVDGSVLIVRKRPRVVLYSSQLEVLLRNDVLLGIDASGGSHVTAEATAASVFDLRASGGSHVSAGSMSAGQLALDASGGSHVTLAGRATQANVDDSGGSRVAARNLVATVASVDVSGGSHLDLTVTDLVSGEASGGSHVTIYGAPTTGQIVASGGSTVTWAGQ